MSNNRNNHQNPKQNSQGANGDSSSLSVSKIRERFEPSNESKESKDNTNTVSINNSGNNSGNTRTTAHNNNQNLTRARGPNVAKLVKQFQSQNNTNNTASNESTAPQNVNKLDPKKFTHFQSSQTSSAQKGKTVGAPPNTPNQCTKKVTLQPLQGVNSTLQFPSKKNNRALFENIQSDKNNLSVVAGNTETVLGGNVTDDTTQDTSNINSGGTSDNYNISTPRISPSTLSNALTPNSNYII